MILPIFYQILDSRGNPTIKTEIDLDDATLTAAVPSGASTGIHEAKELRDGGYAYGGKGVLTAVSNAEMLASKLDWSQADVKEADSFMNREDGTPDKSKLGANAILSVSILQSVVQAKQAGKPLHELLASLAGTKPSLPVPFANVINGGDHAATKLQLQEFMIVPHKAKTFSEAVKQVAETYHVLKKLIGDQYGTASTALGDEGGFAPDITAHEALALLSHACEKSGHEMAFALDPAASEFYKDGKYEVEKGELMEPDDFVEWYVDIVKKYPIVSIEDAFDQDDFASFRKLKQRIAEEGLTCQIVGDDLTVTNVVRIQQAIDEDACNALLLKINQIGSVTEAIASANLAFSAGWNVMVSHRSGETTDTFIADLATGLGTGQIKLGAPARGERTAKYNRLLALEKRYGLSLKQLDL